MGISGISGISNAGAMENVSGIQAKKVQPTDTVSKNLQDEISNVQRKKQELASKEDMSVEEKSKKRQELQQEISSLNVKLRQRQAELSKEQKREALNKEESFSPARESYKDKENKVGGDTKSSLAETDRNGNPKSQAADAGKPNSRDEELKSQNAEKKDKAKDTKDLEDIAIPPAKMRDLAAADDAVNKMKTKEVVIARIEGGIAILKSEIKQDEARGEDTDKKKEKLDREEQRLQQANKPIAENNDAQSAKAAENASMIQATNYTKQDPVFQVVMP